MDYKRILPLRNLDMVTKQTVSIIFLSDNEPVIDIGNLHLKHQSQGQPGFRYHYVIKNNYPSDGQIYYVRPRIFQNGIEGHINDNISNSISICLAGAKGQKLTDGQIESSVSLAIYLISQENLPLDNVKALQEFTGTGEIAGWPELKTKIRERVGVINKSKGSVELPQTENGALDATQFGIIITNTELNTVAKISVATGIPQNILIDMNKNISFGTNIPPDTVVYIPKGVFLQTMKRYEQKNIEKNIVSRIEQEVKTGNIYTFKNYLSPGTLDTYQDLSYLTTMYGGKSAPPWYSKGLDLPGYHSAFIEITKTSDNKVVQKLNFILSPSSSSESRSNSQQMTKTNAGWFIQRIGKNPTNLNISGYMMDAKGILEKHTFLENYKQYIEDTKNIRFEYSNPYSVKIRLEGRDFHGYISSISFNKNAQQPYMYQYNITFVILRDKFIYDEKQAAISASKIANLRVGTEQYDRIPKNAPYTPGQTPPRSKALPDVILSAPVSETISSRFYKMAEEANVDTNLVTPINYTPSIKNAGNAT